MIVSDSFGIVTRLGVWLMPRPPVIRAFFGLVRISRAAVEDHRRGANSRGDPHEEY
jgi:hypothetical protein